MPLGRNAAFTGRVHEEWIPVYKFERVPGCGVLAEQAHRELLPELHPRLLPVGALLDPKACPES